MSENIKKYHPLGKRTLFMFIFKKSTILFLMVPVLFLALFGLSYVSSEYVDIAANIVIGYFVLVMLIFASAMFFGWLKYFRYWIFVDDKDLKIARGMIATQQIGVPYKHIQDIKIQRSLLDQMFGVSDMIITVLGSEEDNKKSIPGVEEEDEIILPSLSKEIALEIQDIVLKKAQVEQVHVLGK